MGPTEGDREREDGRAAQRLTREGEIDNAG